MYSSEFIVIHAVGSIIGIYIVCTVIDYLRIKLVEKPLFKFWDKHWDEILAWYKEKEQTICNKLHIKGE